MLASQITIEEKDEYQTDEGNDGRYFKRLKTDLKSRPRLCCKSHHLLILGET